MATFRDLANRQHGFSDIPGFSENPVVPCPECGKPLEVDEQMETLDPKTGERAFVRAAYCMGCEFVHEF